MAISFRNIPRNLRVPLAYFELDNSMASRAEALQVALILCTAPAGAELPIGVPTLITSADHARAISAPATGANAAAQGAGSALGRQCARWFQNNTSVPLYALAAAETGMTALAGAIDWTGSDAAEGGAIPIYIGGRLVQVSVAAGDDDQAIAVAARDAILADPTLGVTASVTVGTAPETTNITALQVGTLGRLNISIALEGPVGGEVVPDGVVYAITQMPATGGGATPSVTAMLSATGDAAYDFVLCPWNAAADYRDLDEYFNDTSGQWSWAKQLYGHGFTAMQGTVGFLSNFTNTTGRNGQHVGIFGYNGSVTPHDEWMAAHAAQAAGSLIIDPARPVQSLPLIGIRPPPRNLRFTPQERQVLYFDGVASYNTADDGTVMIDRLITTYRRNQWGAPDDSYLDIETMFTAAYYQRFMRNRVLTKFPRHKLADDGTRFGAGQAIVTPGIIRAEMIASYGELEERGLMENADGFEEHLIVERSKTDPNRVDVLLPPDFVNQLRIFAALTQFRL